MSEVAVCIPVFKRTEDIHRLLNNLPPWVRNVYVADDGDNQHERDHIYNDTYTFDLEVYSLEFDAGLSKKRNHLLENTNEEYLLYLDSDHVPPDNTLQLRKILQEKPELGGVSGAIIEPESPDYNVEGQYFRITNDNELVRSPHRPDRLRYEKIAGNHCIYFDFIPNAVMFRRDCLTDYSWDDEIIIGKEHVDFYLGHYYYTSWKFAVTPDVIFEHYRGSGDDEYGSFRYDRERIQEYEEYVLDKYGLTKDIVEDYRWRKFNEPGDVYFLDEYSLLQKAIVIGVCDGPVGLLKAVRERFE